VGVAADCDCGTDIDCLVLEDGDICNGTLVCDVAVLIHKCVVDPATVIECPAPEGVDAPCLEAKCHPLSGECSFAGTGDGAPCDDGDTCTVGDLCVAGACASGEPMECDDGVDCTVDSCAGGVCSSEPESGCCFDDAECPPGERCDQETHVCRPGLCAPCDLDDDCGGAADLCVPTPWGTYCGLECSEGRFECPGDAICTLVEGLGAWQCFPADLDCEGQFDPDPTPEFAQERGPEATDTALRRVEIVEMVGGREAMTTEGPPEAGRSDGGSELDDVGVSASGGGCGMGASATSLGALAFLLLALLQIARRRMPGRRSS